MKPWACIEYDLLLGVCGLEKDFVKAVETYLGKVAAFDLFLAARPQGEGEE